MLYNRAQWHSVKEQNSGIALETSLCFALPSTVIALVGCAYHLLHQLYLSKTFIGPLGLTYASYLVIPIPIALVIRHARKVDDNCKIAAMSGCLIAFLIMIQFRGSVYWPGTFSMAHASIWHSILPLILGILLGIAGPLRMNLESRIQNGGLVGGVSVFVALIWTWHDSKVDIGLYDPHPYSLNIALSLLVLVAAIIGGVTCITERN